MAKRVVDQKVIVHLVHVERCGPLFIPEVDTWGYTLRDHSAAERDAWRIGEVAVRPVHESTVIEDGCAGWKWHICGKVGVQKVDRVL